MAPKWITVGNGFLEGHTSIPDLDPSKLTINLTTQPKDIPIPSKLQFGQFMTDHMLVVHFDPESGWGAPEIKPYAPITLDPASSCLQYSTNIFEGMKAYMGPNGEPRLFRPELNMDRFNTSAGRVALPPFNPASLLTLIKRLVQIEKRWIPTIPDHALYLRPTMLGTRVALGVAPSDHAMIYVICSPAGPYFPIPRPIRLLAVSEIVRSWPGGTGGHKLGLNYSPGFASLRSASLGGWDQVLWLLPIKDASTGGTEELRITEVGAMNCFVVVERDDGEDGWDVITPPLDGTILPGITRASVIELLTTPGIDPPLSKIPSTKNIRVFERNLTMTDLSSWAKSGKLLEAFGVGTAVIVVAIGEIGVEGKDETISLPTYKTVLGPVGRSLHDRLVEIQEGRVEFNGWSVICASD